MGLVLNHNNLSECFVIFPNSETVPDILQLADTPQWVGTHMSLSVDRPRVEIIPIITKLLEDKALEEGEEYEFIPIEVLEPKGSAQFSTPKKEEVPAAALLADQIKSIQTEESCQHFPRRWKLDRCLIELLPKPRNTSLTQAHRYLPFYTV